MTEDSVLAHELATCLTALLGVKVDPHALDAKLIDTYGANSMDLVDIAETVERKYGVTVSNQQVFSLRTFSDLLKLVQTKG